MQYEYGDLTPIAYEYLTSVRKLSSDVIRLYELGCNNLGEIVIPFIDENHELQFVKFRHQTGELLEKKRLNDMHRWEDYQCKSYVKAGGSAILFGTHLCSASLGPLVICFGEYDAMSCLTDQVANCVSPPFGDGSLQWVENQFEWLKTFEKIILYPDLDKNSKTKKRMFEKYEEIAKRLGKHKCYLVSEELRYECKDANELLQKYGLGFNKIAIEAAEEFPEKGLVKLAHYRPAPFQPGYSTGFKDLDKRTGGISKGQLIEIAGDNHAGKTTFALNLLAQSVFLKRPVLYWSGEQNPDDIRMWLEGILAGPEFLELHVDKETGFEYYLPKKEVASIIRKFYEDYVIIYDKRGIDADEFFQVLELAVQRYGVETVFTDNLMAFTGDAENYFLAQGNFAQSQKMFAEDWLRAMIVIVHNRKVEEKREHEGKKKVVIPIKDDVEGSKKVTSWADQIYQLVRLYPNQQQDEYVGVDGVISLCKNRVNGKLLDLRVVFDEKSKRIAPFNNKELLYRRYGWEMLINKQEQVFEEFDF